MVLMNKRNFSLSPAGGGSISTKRKFQIGVDKKLNRITERTSDSYRESGTTGDDSSAKADNKKIEEIASPPSADRKKKL
jgi:hypothetical protein